MPPGHVHPGGTRAQKPPPPHSGEQKKKKKSPPEEHETAAPFAQRRRLRLCAPVSSWSHLLLAPRGARTKVTQGQARAPLRTSAKAAQSAGRGTRERAGPAVTEERHRVGAATHARNSLGRCARAAGTGRGVYVTPRVRLTSAVTQLGLPRNPRQLPEARAPLQQTDAQCNERAGGQQRLN